MHVCIVYDTKRRRGATVHIVNWMREGLEAIGLKVAVKRPREIENFDYDLFIVGSPIYWEKPMKSIVDFLSSNKEVLANKKVAVFIVCLAEFFWEYLRSYIRRRYLKPLEKEIKSSLVGSGVFRGWMRKPDYNQKEKCVKWIREIIGKQKDRIL